MERAAGEPDHLQATLLAWLRVQTDGAVLQGSQQMMGLRLDTGIGVEEFARRFGTVPSDVYGDALHELGSTGLLNRAGGRIRLTRRGRLLGNEVFLRFFEG